MKISIEIGQEKKSMAKKGTKAAKSTKNVEPVVTKKPMEFSKRLLIYDYFIELLLIGVFFICLTINGIYTMIMTNNLIQMGMDVSMITITAPFDLAVVGTILGIWTGQLGITAASYYFMVKSDHRIQIPVKLVNELPQDIKQQVDMTQIIVSALNITTN